jgi:hypothetical protein
MARLARAAARASESMFLEAVDRVDWANRSPNDYLRAVQLALQSGAHLAARNLAAQGAAQHKENLELQRQANILAPPKITRRVASNSSQRPNKDWLNNNENQYRGKWVALRNGELLATANTIDDLLPQIESREGVLLTIV